MFRWNMAWIAPQVCYVHGDIAPNTLVGVGPPDGIPTCGMIWSPFRRGTERRGTGRTWTIGPSKRCSDSVHAAEAIETALPRTAIIDNKLGRKENEKKKH